jgi:hypothetical protein
MWTSDFVILAPQQEAPEDSYLADPEWFAEYAELVAAEI